LLDTRLAYAALVAVYAGERLLELALSRRNARIALAAGGIEVGGEHYPLMVALHTGFLVACPLEVYLLGRGCHPLLAGSMGAVLLVAQGLRYWCIATLGRRWNARVIVVPGTTAEPGGPYRFLRHPNYLAVVLEGVALPLLHGAWLTAVVFSVANAALLRRRIRVEEQALRAHCNWDPHFAALPRLLPAVARETTPP
jgi:methyltransferase